MVVQPPTEHPYPVFAILLCPDCWVGHGGSLDEKLFILKLAESPFATELDVEGKLDLPLKDAIQFCRGQQ